jgi:hypothetical protein
LFDLTHKADLIMELQGLGWRGYNGIAVEPADWMVRFDAYFKTPAELFEALEKEHNGVIQRELAKLVADVLPRIQRAPNRRGTHIVTGLHPFVVQYVIDSLRDSGWWVEFAPATMSIEKQLIIQPKPAG